MPCAFASMHAHTCMRGAAWPARTRTTALMSGASRGNAAVVKILLETGAVDLNAKCDSGCVDVGRWDAVRTCGHIDAHVWMGARVCFNECCAVIFQHELFASEM